MGRPVVAACVPDGAGPVRQSGGCGRSRPGNPDGSSQSPVVVPGRFTGKDMGVRHSFEPIQDDASASKTPEKSCVPAVGGVCDFWSGSGNPHCSSGGASSGPADCGSPFLWRGADHPRNFRCPGHSGKNGPVAAFPCKGSVEVSDSPGFRAGGKP